MLGMLGSLGGSLMSGLFGMMGQSSANDAAAQMAGNRYQTSYKDMMKAGLNPAMMFGSGGPAPMAPPQNTMAAPAAAMKDAASSAVQMQIADKTIDQLTEQIAKTNAEAANIKADLPRISGDAAVRAREAGAIMRIPKLPFNTVVQGGYGSDKMKSSGPIGSGIGAGVSSAGGIASSIGDGTSGLRKVASDVSKRLQGMSGPDLNSARTLKRAWDEKSPELWEAISRSWRKSFPAKNSSTHYKQ